MREWDVGKSSLVIENFRDKMSSITFPAHFILGVNFIKEFNVPLTKSLVGILGVIFRDLSET